MIYLKFQKTLIASALGHADISKSTGAGPVKLDQWVPLVSLSALTKSLKLN